MKNNEIETTPTVTISEYMQSRQHNRKLYARLVEKLEVIVSRYRSGKLIPTTQHFPTLTMEISMSAKYQTPYISIETEERNYQYFGGVEMDVQDALNEVGFTYTECDENDSAYIIHFED